MCIGCSGVHRVYWCKVHDGRVVDLQGVNGFGYKSFRNAEVRWDHMKLLYRLINVQTCMQGRRDLKLVISK